jgi:peptide deformylase
MGGGPRKLLQKGVCRHAGGCAVFGPVSSYVAVATRPILRFPDPKLRQRSTVIEGVDAHLRQLVADMTETMVAAEGAGLAAVQVASPVRLFLIDGHVAGGGETAAPKVFINPEIVAISEEAQTGDEGCLSFPGIFVPVKRGMRARVRAMGLDGETFEVEGEGLYARALQHETDHLNGKLLIDQVGPVKREIIKRKLRKDAEAERQDSAGLTPRQASRSAG